MKRRRLPFRLLDVIPIVIALALGWRLFAAPLFVHEMPRTPPPDLTVPALDGGTISFNALHGRVVFVDFFATWCDPCRQALPVLEAFATAHPEATVVEIDVGEPAATVSSFFRREHLSGPARVALDRRGVLNDRWQVQGYPTIFAIDQYGFVRDHWYGFTPYIAAELTDAEHRYLAERRDAKKAATAARDS